MPRRTSELHTLGGKHQKEDQKRSVTIGGSGPMYLRTIRQAGLLGFRLCGARESQPQSWYHHRKVSHRLYTSWLLLTECYGRAHLVIGFTLIKKSLGRQRGYGDCTWKSTVRLVHLVHLVTRLHY